MLVYTSYRMTNCCARLGITIGRRQRLSVTTVSLSVSLKMVARPGSTSLPRFLTLRDQTAFGNPSSNKLSMALYNSITPEKIALSIKAVSFNVQKTEARHGHLHKSSLGLA